MEVKLITVEVKPIALKVKPVAANRLLSQAAMRLNTTEILPNRHQVAKHANASLWTSRTSAQPRASTLTLTSIWSMAQIKPTMLSSGRRLSLDQGRSQASLTIKVALKVAQAAATAAATASARSMATATATATATAAATAAATTAVPVREVKDATATTGTHLTFQKRNGLQNKEKTWTKTWTSTRPTGRS